VGAAGVIIWNMNVCPPVFVRGNMGFETTGELVYTPPKGRETIWGTN